MKKKIAELLKSKKKVAVTVLAGLAAVTVIGGSAYVGSVPKLTEHKDPIMKVALEEEETPLASKPKVTTKTSKKSTKQKVKLKKASKKTYSKKLPTKKKTSTKTRNTSNASVKTETTVTTATVEKYTKKSKIKVVNKTVTTTVKTTTTEKPKAAAAGNSGSASESAANTTQTPANTAKEASAAPSKGSIDVMSAASKMDSRVLKAYTTLGFTVKYDSSVSYSGYYDTRNRSITLRENNDTIYHELGHFLAFIAGNADTAKSFVAIYNAEKDQYTGVNKGYVTQDSAEYFAESVKDYTLNPSALEKSRPETYKAIEAALNKVTDSQISRIRLVYGRIWK